MAYNGEIIRSCGVIEMDLTRAYAIVVSGDGPNACGHMLLNTGGSTSGRGGNYFHVAELRDHPKYMSQSGYERYLQENGKSELGRYRVRLPNPQAAADRLEELLSERWTWMVVPNNCVDFVEVVLQAGGADFGLISNCPGAMVAGENTRNVVREIQVNTTDRAIERRIWQFMMWAQGQPTGP